MAFSLYDWIKGGFKVEDTSIEGLKTLANNIIASDNLGQTGSTKTWAREALKALNNTSGPGSDDATKIANASKYLTGKSNSSSGYFQGRKPKEVAAALKEYEAETKDKLANLASNIANETDFSDPNLSEETKTRLTARSEESKAKLAELASQSGLPDSVLSQYQAIEKTASGDYVPKGSMDYKPNAHTGESLGIDRQADGTYKVMGRTPGPDGTYKDYGSFADQSQANAYATQIQSGGTPGVSGQPDVYATTPLAGEGPGRVIEGSALSQVGTVSSTDSATNDASSTVASALESSVSSKEQAATAADPSLTVTPEMRAQWLQEGYDELAANANWQETLRTAEFDLGTTVNRLIEDTRIRETALATQYKENLKTAQSDLQDTGMLYGGVRSTAEQKLADATNTQLAAEDLSFQRNLADTAQSGAQYFGSDYATNTIAPSLGETTSVGRVLPGSPTFQTGSRQSAFAPTGSYYGSSNVAADTEAITRQNEKESAFRDLTSQYA